MLIALLRPLVRLSLWVFYRRVEICGREDVPGEGPVIFAPNHPNVMLDVLVIGLHAPGRAPRFLGKSTLFGRPVYAWFMRHLGVIPVARRQDAGAVSSSNREMLREVSRSLGRGESLALFPEGSSKASVKVRRLKSGTAHIALKAEDEANGRAGICVVPVGLTYSDQGAFRSDLTVQFGRAIGVAPLLPAFRTSRDEAELALTDQIYNRLTDLTWQVEGPILEQFVRDFSAVYGVREAGQVRIGGRSARVSREQEVIRALGGIAQGGGSEASEGGVEGAEATTISDLASRLRAHRLELRRLHIAPSAFRSATSAGCRPDIAKTFAAVLLAPAALYGCIWNLPPLLAARLYARRHEHNPDMLATAKVAGGVAAFVVWYVSLAAPACIAAGLPEGLLYALSLPASGALAMIYDERILQHWPQWLWPALPSGSKERLRLLSEEHDELRRKLDDLVRTGDRSGPVTE